MINSIYLSDTKTNLKLSEAHDALHNFSCKMLASRQCDECTYKEDEPLPVVEK